MLKRLFLLKYPKTLKENLMYCSNCGRETPPQASVCPNCGANLNNNQPVRQDDSKDWLTTLLLCIFTGGLGIHRFYTGHTTIGIIQLLTAGGCGVWALIDLIQIITDSFVDANGNPLVKNH